MKRKKIIVCIMGIVSIILLLVKTNNKDVVNTFKQDGVLFALTLDGESISSFPDYNSGKYSVDINCNNDNAKVQYKPVKVRLDNGTYRYEWKLTVEKIKGNVTCNLDFSEKNVTTLKKQVEENALAAGDVAKEVIAGYRYVGQNPDNYIWFNNEKWRIIGSIPTCTTASCGTSGSNLVKIIRKNSIGGLAYDVIKESYQLDPEFFINQHTAAWGTDATLYHLLNSIYWGKGDGTDGEYCYGYEATSKAKCDYTEIGLSANDFYGAMVEEVYWNTGASYFNEAKASDVYADEILTQTVKGRVGLMAASDYGYAASSIYWTYPMRTDNGELYDYRVVTNSNWLYIGGNEWTCTQVGPSSDTYNVITIDEIGYCRVDIAGYAANTVRPVVYLDPSVYIVDGSGTESDPYILGYLKS